MSCPDEYWIWLQRTLGIGFFADEILSYFSSPRDVYEAGKSEWLKSGLFTSAAIGRLSRYSPSQSYDVMSACKKNDWTVVTQDSPYFPEALKNIYASPLVLYVWGDPYVLKNELTVGMVGTRDCSDYGRDVAYNLAFDLAKAGFTVVSGGALGIDSASHSGAVESGGKTVAFLGCGLGYDYLRSNGKIRKMIAHNGAVVSEFLPYSPPSRRTFPVRNRLISGISLGTVVIEAGEKSGSLITAKNAFEQGRDVFAVPGDVTSSNYFGTNKLIRDGAKPVFSAYDILFEYLDMYSDKINTEGIKDSISRKAGIISDTVCTEKHTEPVKTKNKEKNDRTMQVTFEDASVRRKLPDYASESARKLYAFLTPQPLLADIIAENSGMKIADVLSSLTELEMYGCAVLHSGDRYSL